MKFFNILFSFIFFLNFCLQTIVLQPSLFGQGMFGGKGGKMPPISEAELQEMFEFLEKADDETIKALSEIGEQYIKEMEEKGLNPFEELFGTPPSDDAQEPVIETPVVEKPKEVEIPKNCSQAKECRDLLKSIIDLIASIRLKAEGDRRSLEQLNSWKYNLDDIVYFAHIFTEDKLLKYFTDKEFEKVYKLYADLEHELKYLESIFIIPEQSLEKINPYTLLGLPLDSSWQEVNTAYQKLYKEKHPNAIKMGLSKAGKAGEQLEKELALAQQEFDELSQAYNTIMQKEQSKQVLDSIIEAISKAINGDIILESKKVIEKYDPAALKIKQQQEEIEKKARKDQEDALKRRPPYAPRLSEPSFGGGGGFEPSDYDKGSPFVPSFDQYSGDYDKQSGTRKSKEGEPGKPGSGGKAKEEGKQTKEDKKSEGTGGKSVEKRSGGKKKEPEGKVKKKLGTIQKDFEAIVTEIDEKSLEADPEDYDSGEVLFKDFGKYLVTEYKDEDLKTAKGINLRLTNMSKKLREINRQLDNDSKELSRADKKELKENAQFFYSEYFDKDKGTHFKKINSLLNLPTETFMKDDKKFYRIKDTPISEIKKNMHLAIDDNITGKQSEPVNKTIAAVRGKASPDTDILSSFLDEFHKVYDKLK